MSASGCESRGLYLHDGVRKREATLPSGVQQTKVQQQSEDVFGRTPLHSLTSRQAEGLAECRQLESGRMEPVREAVEAKGVAQSLEKVSIGCMCSMKIDFSTGAQSGRDISKLRFFIALGSAGRELFPSLGRIVHKMSVSNSGR